MRIMPDVPQKVLDAFNRIDFKNTGSIQKSMMRAFLEKWASDNLPMKTSATKVATLGGAKMISPDFDEKLIAIINRVDWGACSLAKINYVTDYINDNASKFVKIK